MANVEGAFLVNGLPRANATVKLWNKGAFASHPAKGTALPTGSPVASGTTGTANGADGAYSFQNVAVGEYYVSFEWNADIIYEYAYLADTNTVSDLKTTWGAKGDGITDDTAALQAYANSLAVTTASSGQTDLYIPAGTYIISGTIAFPNSVSNFRVRGAGYYSSLIKWNGASGNPVISLTNCRGAEFTDFAILGNATASKRPSAAILAQVDTGRVGAPAAEESRFERLYITGLSASGFVNGIQFSVTDAAMAASGDVNNDQHIIRDCHIAYCSSNGIAIKGKNSIWHKIIGGQIEQCLNAGISIISGTVMGGGFCLFGTGFLTCGTVFELGPSYHNVQIVGAMMEGCSGFCTTPVQVSGTSFAGTPTPAAAATRSLVSVIGCSIHVNDNTALQFDATVRGQLDFIDCRVTTPAGVTMSFPTSGCTVNIVGGSWVINSISYDCNLNILDVTHEAGAPTYTNINGNGNLRLRNCGKGSNNTRDMFAEYGSDLTNPLSQLQTAGLLKLQPTNQQQTILQMGPASVTGGYSGSSDAVRVRFNGGGAASNPNGMLTYRPAQHQFYMTGFQSAFDDTAVDLKLNGKATFVSGTDIGASGSPILACIAGSKTWDPASVNDGAMTSTTVTVTGASIGDQVTVGFSQAVPAGCLLVGAVTSADTVTVTLFNKSGSTQDLASGTLRAAVLKF